MLKAAQLDYRNAFRKHFHAYSNWNEIGSIISKRVILFYCVECGLKYMIMKQEGINYSDTARLDIQNDLSSHDIQKMLTKYLHQSSFSFPSFNTIHGQQVNPSSYHQAYRYALCPLDTDENKCVKYCEELEKISNWINNCIDTKK